MDNLPEIDDELLKLTLERPKIAFDPELPKPKIDKVAVKEPEELNIRQKQTVGVIAYAVHAQGIAVSPDEILNAWPVGSVALQLKAGVKPSDADVAAYMDTQEYLEDCEKRGIPAVGSNGLTDRQVALLSILSDSSLRMGLEARLTRAGVSKTEYRSWKRQTVFGNAYKRMVSTELQDAAEHLDVQLLSMAQNGNLKAIQYANELMGRGPNNKQNVDAQKFVQLVLESIMRHCSTEQIQAIHADLELASKLAIEA